MKTIPRVILFTVMAFAFIPAISIAQKVAADSIPPVVKSSFQTKFPGALKLKWKKKSGNIFEAEFELRAMETSAKFDQGGKLMETETAIKKSTLPQAIKDKIAKDYVGYDIKETQTIKRADSPQTNYEVHLKNKTEELKIEFSEAAAVISKTSKPVKPK